MQYGYLKLVHFLKKSGRLSSRGSEILTFGNHCSANFQPILDCFIPKFKLEYDDLENIKNGSSKCCRFQFTSNQKFKVFLGHPVFSVANKNTLNTCPRRACPHAKQISVSDTIPLYEGPFWSVLFRLSIRSSKLSNETLRAKFDLQYFVHEMFKW